MKYRTAILSIVFTMICVSALLFFENCEGGNSSKNEVKLQRLADSAGDKVRIACKILTNTNDVVFRTVIKNHYKNSDLKKYQITITISWEGGITGRDYNIDGKITCNYDGSNAVWELINSNCFGCSCPTYRPLGDL